jgi:tricorn protease
MRLQSTALALVIGSLALPILAQAEPIKRIQFPAISPDGSTIVFSWQNDLWSVPRAGGKAIRITIHPAIDTRPIWYPDGSRIAFSSNRYSSFDIFTMKPDGSDLRRVTFDTSTEYPTSVSDGNRFIYGSTSLWSRGDLFRIPSLGGDLQRLTSHPFEATFAANLSLDGSKVFYNRGAYRETSWQKPTMQSSALPEVWVADNTVPLSNHKRVTNNEFTDLSPLPMPDGSMIVVSNRGGFPNIWRLGGKQDKALTAHVDGTSRNPSLSRDGKFVAYEFESEVYVVDTATGTDTLLTVEVPGDQQINPMQELSMAGGVDQFAVSPDGKRTVVASRGDLFILPEKGGTTRRLTTNLGRDSSPVWLDAKTVLYSAMEGGNRRLKTVGIDGKTQDFLVGTNQDLVTPTLSPDGTMVAFNRGDNEIVLSSPKGENAKVIARGDFTDALQGANVFTWSPDSKYLAAAMVKGRKTEITLIEVATGKLTVVATMVNRPQRGNVTTPQFTPNGRSLFFASPEYDESDLYVVDLVPADITYSEDDLDKLDEEKKKDKPANAVEVYLPNIEQRLRRLTTTGVGPVTAAADSKSVYAITTVGLQSISLATGVAQTLIAANPANRLGDVNFTNGKLYAINNGQLSNVTIAGPASATSPISMNASYTVDVKGEEKALFEEIWWSMDRLYYDVKMNNKNWVAIKAKYEKLVPYAYDRTDFYRMMGEMMEELDSSHLGATAPTVVFPGVNNDSTAFLGIDLDPIALSKDGSCVVARVVPGSPADHPQSMLKVGDQIIKVDGETTASAPLSVLLNQKTLKKVSLTINRDGVVQVIQIKPSSQALRGALEYDAWVKGQREMVKKLSENKLGYVHIRAMDKPSLDQFLREIRTEGEGRKGIVVDVRFNGGGSTAVDVLNVLIRTPWLVRTTRGEFGLKLSENIYRSDALEMPTALMCNTFSFSNAEVITEGFRKLKLGPIVGERTPGYVIGTGAISLWDRGTIRLPSIGAYAVNGENLENNGRKPDFTVWFDPNAWAEGRDLQTEKAVLELLKSVGK